MNKCGGHSHRGVVSEEVPQVDEALVNQGGVDPGSVNGADGIRGRMPGCGLLDLLLRGDGGDTVWSLV